MPCDAQPAQIPCSSRGQLLKALFDRLPPRSLRPEQAFPSWPGDFPRPSDSRRPTGCGESDMLPRGLPTPAPPLRHVQLASGLRGRPAPLPASFYADLQDPRDQTLPLPISPDRSYSQNRPHRPQIPPPVEFVINGQLFKDPPRSAQSAPRASPQNRLRSSLTCRSLRC